MRVARKLHRAGGWSGAADRLTLDHDARHMRRAVVTCDSGEELLIDLAEPTALAHGDAVETQDGALVEIVAAPEALMEARSPDPLHLVRTAWHVGNRHLPAEIRPDRLVLRRDHVIADMLRKLGCEVREFEGPFQPEGGAYGHGRTHGHDHAHGHRHAHDHAH